MQTIAQFRIYRTGDLGRLRSDGALELMGRKGRTDQITRVQRRALPSRMRLVRQPGVTDAIVLLHEGAAGQEPCLVGYIIDLECIAVRHS